jgi:protein-S-isoprenylcysteine O-methyltransferase Ste14
MADNEKDVPGVIVFPPLIPLTVVVAGALLDWLFPVAIISAVPAVPRIVIGAALFALGIASAIMGERAFKRIGTNVNPLQPALSLAGQGIFAHLRNPMYVGMALAVLGIVVGFGLEWTFLLLIAGAFVMHYGVVLREERYLERKFGDDYRAYKKTVPRYGFKF